MLLIFFLASGDGRLEQASSGLAGSVQQGERDVATVAIPDAHGVVLRLVSFGQEFTDHVERTN